MTAEEIRSAWKATPFEPFDIRLTDGTILPVPTSDHIGVSPYGNAIVLHQANGSSRVVDMPHILEIIFHPPGSAASTG